MNRVFIVRGCHFCQQDELATILANSAVDMGEKVLITDIKANDPSIGVLEEAFGSREEIMVPSMMLSNRGIVKDRFYNHRRGRIDNVFKFSNFDWVHSRAFIKAEKGDI